MNLEYKCLKCGSDKYIVKTTAIPEKSPGLKIDIGTYYIKTCIECGYTELYSAKIIDKEFTKSKKMKRYAKATP
ncbi:MAG: zinc ribbon domain-containing protein [Cetobacterium sp.]